MYEFHSRHDLEKVHVLQLFFTAPLLTIRMQRFFHQTTHRYLFTPGKWSDRHSEGSHWLGKFWVKTNSTEPLQIISQLIQCIRCDPVNLFKSCDAFVQVTDQFKHNCERFIILKIWVKTNSTAPLQITSQSIQCICCDPIDVCNSCDAFVQVTDQFKHNYGRFIFGNVWVKTNSTAPLQIISQLIQCICCDPVNLFKRCDAFVQVTDQFKHNCEQFIFLKIWVKTNSTAPLQIISQFIQCIHCDPINVCNSCDAFVQVTDQFKHNCERFIFW